MARCLFPGLSQNRTSLVGLDHRPYFGGGGGTSTPLIFKFLLHYLRDLWLLFLIGCDMNDVDTHENPRFLGILPPPIISLEGEFSTLQRVPRRVS